MIEKYHFLGVWAQAKNHKRNILLIIVDDLRPELGVYQRPDHALRFNSPNIDKFAQTALMFDRAYVNYGSCNPSRNSMFTGFRPETLGLVTKDKLASTIMYRRHWGRGLTTLPRRMRGIGYKAVGIGKVFHQERRKDFNSYIALNNQNFHFCPKNALSCKVNSEFSLVDHKVATKGTEFIRVQSPGKPFFLILGFHRPHVAYSVPNWAFDRIDSNQLNYIMTNASALEWYDAEGIPANKNFPNATTNQFPAMADRNPREPLASLHRSVEERKWYAAAVYWVDYCIGRVLKALDESNVKNDTMVVILGDHGMELGEYGRFSKSSPFETTSRIPLLFRVPWMPQTQGKRTSSLFEGIDLGASILGLLGYDSTSNTSASSVGRLLSAEHNNRHGATYNNNSSLQVAAADTYDLDGRNLMDSKLLDFGEGNSQLPLFSFYNSPLYLSLKQNWSKQPGQSLLNPNLFCHKCFAVTTNTRCHKGNVWLACEILNRDNKPDNPPYLFFSMRSPTHRYFELRKASPRFVVDWTTAGLMGRALFNHENDNGLMGIDGSEFERTNLAPCASCEGKNPRVVVIEDYRLPLLAKDQGITPDSLFPPELDTLSAKIALVVAQHSIMLRSIIRDKSPACNGHGLPLVSGECKCYAPWGGKKCEQAQDNVFST